MLTYPQKTSISILGITFLSSVAFPALANPSQFYQALAKTQKGDHSLAIKDLEILGSQLRERGDLINAYRSEATSILINYDLNSDQYAVPSTSIKGLYNRPNWYIFDSCWSNNGDGFSGGSCEFGIGWMQPPTKTKNFGGVIILTNRLSPNLSKGDINGFLDAVVIPKLKSNETVISSCESANSFGKKQNVLALTTFNSKLNKYTKIRQAWYPNIQMKRLQPIDAKRVTCPPPYDPEG